MRVPLVIFLLLSVAAAQAPKNAPLRLSGRLEPKRAGTEPGPLWLRVGPVRYEFTLGDEAAKAAAKLRGKFVVLTAQPDRKSQGTVIVRPDALTPQARQTLPGYVRATADKKFPYRLETKDGVFVIAAAEARKFKKHVGGYVAAQGNVTTDGTYRQLEAVRAVERTVPPGARQPRKGDEALAGRWKGTLLAKEVPAGVPGAKPGDTFPVSFAADKKLKAVTGRLADTYDVNGVRARKFSAKRRTVTFDLDYTFGSGTYSVRCEGKFTDDFKKITGTWSSSFLGKGSFTIDWSK